MGLLLVTFWSIVEEFVEDNIVTWIARRINVHEYWATVDYYKSLPQEHPNQVVENPSLVYGVMPYHFSLLLVFESVSFAFLYCCEMLGMRWVVGLDETWKAGDNTAWMWPWNATMA